MDSSEDKRLTKTYYENVKFEEDLLLWNVVVLCIDHELR